MATATATVTSTTATGTTAAAAAAAAEPLQNQHQQHRQPGQRAGSPKAVIFLANKGQDPTECAVPWSILRQAGCTVHFATENGAVAAADPLLLQSTVFAGVLGAKQAAADAYSAMAESREHRQPRSWRDEGFDILGYDIVLLPGGHDKAIRQYLESQTLHDHLVRLLPHTKRGPGGRKVLGAICHGVLALAFARCPGAEKSLLAEYGLQTTTLPMWMEATAWVASQAWLMGGYFRTYGASRWCYSDVEQAGGTFIRGPMSPRDPNYRYVSARFPGDAELLARALLSEATDHGDSNDDSNKAEGV